MADHTARRSAELAVAAETRAQLQGLADLPATSDCEAELIVISMEATRLENRFRGNGLTLGLRG
jgi:hypothetical protein